jgi:DNA invertase Pin-like site-specific DNA recombinase
LLEGGVALLPRKPAKHPAKPKRGKKLEVEEPGVLYGRYSSHNQKDISVEQQFEKGYELAAEYGIRIIDTYADRAVSGRTDKRRDFQRMMTDAAKGKFRYVIAWKSNRMGRNMLEALINEARLQDLGVRVLYVEEDFDDTAAGRFAARSMMNVNQFYSENMAEDIKRGLYDNAANCMVANGHLPYGYKADETLHYAIDEPKAAVIREIFTRVSCGEAFVDIMASLNARGIKTSYGRPWGRSSFQKILSNERYRGIYIYGDVRKEGGIPRIISDELYFKVQEVITTKKNPQGRHRVNGDYLLTGKLFCGHCKSPMTGISGTSRSGNLHYYYVCQKRRTEKTCEKKNLRRDDIELQVAKAIKRRTLDDDTINWIADSVVEYSQHQESASGIGLLEDQLKDTQRSIKNLMAAIEQGIITPTTKARLMELEKEQSDIDRKITMAKADVIPVNRDQLVGWLKKLQAGDVHDKKYQAELFDTFLIAVYVYDNPDGQDYMKVVFNYAGSKNTVEIPLDPSVIDNVENIETGAVRLSSAQVHQKYQLPFLGDWYFSLRGRWSRSLSPSGEIHLPPPKSTSFERDLSILLFHASLTPCSFLSNPADSGNR